MSSLFLGILGERAMDRQTIDYSLTEDISRTKAD